MPSPLSTCRVLPPVKVAESVPNVVTGLPETEKIEGNERPTLVTEPNVIGVHVLGAVPYSSSDKSVLYLSGVVELAIVGLVAVPPLASPKASVCPTCSSE